MKVLRYTFSTLFTFLTVLSLSAQSYTSDFGCGTIPGKSVWLKKYQAGEFPRGEKSATVQYVPLNLVVLGTSDGNGFLNPDVLLDGLELLNSDFRDQNIQFFISGEIKYVSSDRFYEHDSEDGDAMRRSFNVPFHMNTYIVGSANGNCGYYSSSNEGVVLQKDCIGGIDRTWSHEVGHYLSLPHTFFGWEIIEDIDRLPVNEPAPEFINFGNRRIDVELVDGSNCTDAADGFCDTPPDYVMQRWQCQGSTYIDSLLDPDSVRFAVPGANIMSYALDACVNSFSSEQRDAMTANLDARTGLVSTAEPDTEGADAAALQLLSPENDSRLVYEDSVTLTWSSVPNADFYVVQLNNRSGFSGAIQFATTTADTSITILDGLTSNRDYYWRVRPVNNYVVSGDFGAQVFEFRNGRQAVSTIDPGLDVAVSVFPNPIGSGQQLGITGKDLDESGVMNYQVIDAAGRVLINREGLRIAAAGFSETVPTGNLSPGIYFLRLRLNGKLLSRRIVVTP